MAEDITDILDEDGNVKHKEFTPDQRIVIATQSALLECKNIDDVHTCWAEMLKKFSDIGMAITIGDAEKVQMMLQAVMVANFGTQGAIFRIEDFFLNAVNAAKKASGRNVRSHKIFS